MAVEQDSGNGRRNRAGSFVHGSRLQGTGMRVGYRIGCELMSGNDSQPPPGEPIIQIENFSRRGFLQGMLGTGAFVLGARLVPTQLFGADAGAEARAGED